MKSYFDTLSLQEKVFLISAVIGALCYFLYLFVIISISAFGRKQQVIGWEKGVSHADEQKRPRWLTSRFIQGVLGSWMTFGVVGLAFLQWFNANQIVSFFGAIISGGLSFWIDLTIDETKLGTGIS
ncbi:MAG: hypothetical protein ACK2TV_14705 [Anaerolineales bacterium]